MNVTPIYQLGYFVPNMTVGNDLDMDKNRFTTIENQLYNVYNIFGNGILAVYDSSGQQVSSWSLSSVPGERSVQVSSGKGHIAYKYAETIAAENLDLILPGGVTSGSFWYYLYATPNLLTPTEKSVTFVASLTQISDPVNYIGLGAAFLYISPTDGSFTVTVYNTAAYGRQEISLFASLTSLVKNHVHIGGPDNPSPIDLGKHVTGFLSSENINNIDLSKVTSGTLDPNRLPLINHNSLTDIGTLTHDQIDSLLAALQYPGVNYNLSDYGIVNRLQIILALKKQSGFFNIDGEQLNSIFYLPYPQLENFVDRANTTAVVNNEIHRVYGVTGLARQSNIIKINTTQDFNTALFYAEDSVINPPVSNIQVTGVTTTSQAGTINMPYGLTGSASTIYVSSSQDSYVSAFSTSGVFINRRIDFDPNLNLNSPLGLWYDKVSDYLYIADTFNHRIIVTDSTFTNLIAKIGANDASGVPGPGSGDGFNFPKGVYGLGNTFYVADSGNNQIQKYIWQSGNANWQRTYQYSDGTIFGLNQGLSDPRGVFATAVGTQGFLFVADYNNHRVLCGIETNNSYSVYQVLGQNSAGFGIYNTNLITYAESLNVVGTGAAFTFSNTIVGTISTIGVANSGVNYSDFDTFIVYYNGNNNGLINVLTDGAGHITTAFVSYGFSTVNNLGFDHPQGIAFTKIGSNLNLLITDTDNNRVVSYNASSVGIGTTNNQFGFGYSFGTAGSLNDTESLIYFNRPTGIYAQQGFGTVFVADSLNNRVHGLTTTLTTFATPSISSLSTSTFGIGDTSLTSGGITLTQPIGYVGIATPSTGFVTPPNWFVGEQISQGTQVQADIIARYSYVTFSTKTLDIQDTIATAIGTINETANQNLGQISCYLIFADNFSDGTNITFALTNNAERSSIRISNLFTLRQQGLTNSQLFNFVALSNFTTQPNPSVIGFGFKWSTETGWANNDTLQLGWYLPEFDSNIIRISYPKVLSYRQKYGFKNSIFAFNANRYSPTGVFVFRFDSGLSGGTTFDYGSFIFANPVSAGGSSSIQFYYRTANTLQELNTSGQKTQLFPVSGGSAPINASGRFIDLLFYFNASNVDSLAAPVLSSISLYYTVYGEATGIIYDTNVNNAPAGTYPRFKWSQGVLSNLDILPVPGDNTQSYQIEISNTENLNKYTFLSTNNLQFASGDNSSGFVDINNSFYLSPYQAFAGYESGLLSPQHYVSNGSNGYFIADTGNDRVIEVGSDGSMVRSIQGNITLPRCDRAFAVLGAYYNQNTKQLYVPFSQYLFLPTSYLQQLAIYINGVSYNLSNSAFFIQTETGLFAINSNNQSATFYATATTAMDAIIGEYPDDIKFQIQNPQQNPPFQVPTTGRSDGNEPEDESITYDNITFSEFVSNRNQGVGTVLNFENNITEVVIDPTTFGSADSTTTVLWSYWQGNNQFPNYSTFYSIPVNVFPIYFDNIFKPLHLDYTESETLVVSTVGNNAVRAYNNLFELNYKISIGNFNFNEKLGGSTVVLDRGALEPGNILLVANPGIGTTTIIGNVFVYNRNTASLINNYQYENLDAVKAYPNDDNYLILLNDRLGRIRSKLIEISQDGTNTYSLSNVFTRPVSLAIEENGFFYVTDITGQYGNIYFRTFIGDGSGNSTGQSGGPSGGGFGGNTGSPPGGNAGGSLIGGGSGGASTP
jgi:hypothetical protein